MLIPRRAFAALVAYFDATLGCRMDRTDEVLEDFEGGAAEAGDRGTGAGYTT